MCVVVGGGSDYEGRQPFVWRGEWRGVDSKSFHRVITSADRATATAN